MSQLTRECIQSLAQEVADKHSIHGSGIADRSLIAECDGLSDADLERVEWFLMGSIYERAKSRPRLSEALGINPLPLPVMPECWHREEEPQLWKSVVAVCAGAAATLVLIALCTVVVR